MADRSANWLVLAGFLAATYLVAGISAYFTTAEIPHWYAALAKPAFNPPNWIFGPVWTTLYTLMAIAAWLVSKSPAAPARSTALALFWIQLALNFAWSFIFFSAHQIGFALIEILVLWLTLVLTMIAFFRVSPIASWLFVPYLAWVSFASLLNYSLWRLN